MQRFDCLLQLPSILQKPLDTLTTRVPVCKYFYLANIVGQTIKSLVDGLDDEKGKIDTAAASYMSSMGFLTATMTMEVLRRDRHREDSEQWGEIPAWLWDGNYWERHKLLHDERVSGTGTWFLDSSQFQNWLKEEKCRFLIGPGMRTNPLTIVLTLVGAGKSFIAYASSSQI